jgi:hypothetical protein
MITFTRLGTYGRLGNQLFQYAILLAVGAKNNYEVKIPILDDKKWHGQLCLLNNFNITAKTLEPTDHIEHHYNEMDHKLNHPSNRSGYDPAVFSVPDNCDLFGYFGDYRYLKEYENLIIKELTPKASIIERSRNRLAQIKERYPGYLIVSLHIRRGDTSLDMYSRSDMAILDSNSVYYSYLCEAKKIFKDVKCKFLVFTGGSQTDNTESDYVWCRNNLNTDEYIYCDGNNSTMDDFTLMYLSDAHILSPLSTMSWWVGFLDKKNNKITVAPKKYWYLIQEMPNGFYPDNFLLI